MIKRSVLALFIVLLFSSNQVGAQDVNIISGNQSNQPVQPAVPDTLAATHHPPHRVRTCFAF